MKIAIRAGLGLMAMAVLMARASASASGSAIYAENCAYCHGNGGAGNGPNSAKLNPRPSDLTRSRLGKEGIATIVRNGKKACPSWKSSLGEDEILAVAAYAKSLEK